MKELLTSGKAKSPKISAEHMEAIAGTAQARHLQAIQYCSCVITEKAIINWLHNEVTRVAEEEGYRLNHMGIVDHMYDARGYAWGTASKAGIMGLFNSKTVTVTWEEMPFDKYPHLVPEYVAKKYQEAKQTGIFSSIVVASTDKKIEPAKADPLLLGRIDGRTDRYGLAQWDEDILLDDLI